MSIAGERQIRRIANWCRSLVLVGSRWKMPSQHSLLPGILLSVSIVLAVNLCPSVAQAQAQPQVVQLPTFSFFSVSTTVVAPDSGRAYLGGTSQSRSGSRSHGVPLASRFPGVSRMLRSRAIGAETGTSSASVSAKIHDLEGMDRALLSKAGGRDTLTLTKTERKGLTLSASITKAAASDGRSMSLAAIRERNKAVSARQYEELRSHWQQACRAEAAGRLGAARCQFVLVARGGTGKVRAAALSRIRAIDARQPVTNQTAGNR